MNALIDPRTGKVKDPYSEIATLPVGGYDLVGLRLTESGTPILDSLIQQATDSHLFWQLTIAGTPAALVLIAKPSCTDIDAQFTTCAQLDTAVATCSALETWGYN